MFQFHELDLNWRPSHAYIPGKNSRHSDGVFDQFKPDLSISNEELANCIAWHIGQLFFREEYYWEAHEVWEAVWILLDQESAPRALVRSLIQLTNAGLKGKMGREKAQTRLLDLAKAACPDFNSPKIMGFTQQSWKDFYGQASRSIPHG